MTNERKLIRAKALLSAIVREERRMEYLKRVAEGRRERLDTLMAELGVEQIARAGWEALKYVSHVYEIDAESLQNTIGGDLAVLERLMPRKVAASDVRKTAEGDLFEDREGLAAKVRECCVKHRKVSLKVQPEKKQVKLAGKRRAA